MRISLVPMPFPNNTKKGEKMKKEHRQKEILDMLRVEGMMSPKELTDRLYMSLSTVYRDLRDLENQKLLIISPVPLHPQIQDLRPDSSLRNGYTESLQYAQFYEHLAGEHAAWFLNAADFAHPSIVDCVHMDEDAHRSLGHAVAQTIGAIFQSSQQA